LEIKDDSHGKYCSTDHKSYDFFFVDTFFFLFVIFVYFGLGVILLKNDLYIWLYFLYYAFNLLI